MPATASAGASLMPLPTKAAVVRPINGRLGAFEF